MVGDEYTSYQPKYLGRHLHLYGRMFLLSHCTSSIFHHPKTDYNPSRWLLRLKPEFRDRMIKAGYSGDPTGRNNQTMGMLYDLNRAFLGLESPLNEEFNK